MASIADDIRSTADEIDSAISRQPRSDPLHDDTRKLLTTLTRNLRYFSAQLKDTVHLYANRVAGPEES